MKKQIILFVLILIMATSCRQTREKTPGPIAENGNLNLQSWDYVDGDPVKLDGEWEFYWEKFYNSNDFKGENHRIDLTRLTPFKPWNSIVIDNSKIGGSGYGTYRLMISLPPGVSNLALQIGSIDSAYELEVNGKIIKTMGKIGKSTETSVPNTLKTTSLFSTSNADLEIIFRISNFDHRSGGPWDSVFLGSPQMIIRKNSREENQAFFMLGVFVIMSLSYLSLFIIKRSDRIYQYFSLFCLSIAIRVMVQGGVPYLLDYFPAISWRIRFALEYSSVYLALILFMHFIYAFFQEKWLKYELRVVETIGGLFTLSAFFLPLLLNSYLITYFQIILLIAGIQITRILLKNALKKNMFAWQLLAGGLILFGTVINDILHAKGILNTFYMLPFGMLIFIIFHDNVLSMTLHNYHDMIDRQKKQLLKTNTEYLTEIQTRIDTETALKESNENLILARTAIIYALAEIAEHRDSDTGAHLKRIQEFNKLLAIELAKTPQYQDYITIEYIEDLYLSSILHDIGKVGIADSILLKPGKLTSDEFEKIQDHTLIGGKTIINIEKNIKVQTFLTLAKDIAFMHHEKWAGTGYPYGLSGQEIPLSARITAVADVYDALTSKRIYKGASPHEEAVEYIKSERGSHFDPDIVDAFLTVHEQFRQLRDEINASTA